MMLELCTIVRGCIVGNAGMVLGGLGMVGILKSAILKHVLKCFEICFEIGYIEALSE